MHGDDAEPGEARCQQVAIQSHGKEQGYSATRMYLFACCGAHQATITQCRDPLLRHVLENR